MWNTADHPDGPVTIKIEASDTVGTSREVTVVVTVDNTSMLLPLIGGVLAAILGISAVAVYVSSKRDRCPAPMSPAPIQTPMAVTYFPHCGAQNAQTFRFCKKCGVKLSRKDDW